MSERVATIRQALHLDRDIWLDLPDDLIEIAFRPSNVIITKKLAKSLDEKYSLTNLEVLEFLGDAVLELAVTQIIFDEAQGSPGSMSQLREKFVRNTSLFCLMHRLNLCGLTARTNKPYTIKDCADILEAIIGALYYYLVYIKQDDTYMSILQDYIEDYLYDPVVRQNLFEQNIPIDGCMIEGVGSAFQLGKDYKIRPPKIIAPKKTAAPKKNYTPKSNPTPKNYPPGPPQLR